MKNKKWVGGIRINATDSETAFRTFLNGATEIKMISYDSVACIGVVIKNPNSNAYTNTRLGYINDNINQIFVKIMLMDPNATRVTTKRFPAIRLSYTYPDYCNYEVGCPTSFDDEINMQLDVFRHSFEDTKNSPADALCPALMYYDKNAVFFRDFLLDKLWVGRNINNPQPRSIFKNGRITYDSNYIPHEDCTYPSTNKLQLLHQFLNNEMAVTGTHFPISIIAMEYLDGFVPLKTAFEANNEVITSPNMKNAIVACLYETMKFRSYGFYHQDLHYSNIFINLTYNPTRDPNIIVPQARAMIIDFGRVTKRDPRYTTGFNRIAIQRRLEIICKHEKFALWAEDELGGGKKILNEYGGDIVSLVTQMNEEYKDISKYIMSIIGPVLTNLFGVYKRTLDALPVPRSGPFFSVPSRGPFTNTNSPPFGGSVSVEDPNPNEMAELNEPSSEKYVVQPIKKMDETRLQQIYKAYFPNDKSIQDFEDAIKYETELLGKNIDYYTNTDKKDSVGGRRKRRTRKRKSSNKRRKSSNSTKKGRKSIKKSKKN